MLRRLLEASTRAAGQQASSSQLAMSTAALQINQSLNQMGQTMASSSSGGGHGYLSQSPSSPLSSPVAAMVVAPNNDHPPPVPAAATVTTALLTSTSTTSVAGVATTTVATSVVARGPHYQHAYNSSVYLLPDSDDLEYSILAAFSDMKTVFLACISTLLPLIVALGIAFGIRHVWRKYKDRRCSGSSSGLPWYRGVGSREDTAESLHHRAGSTGSSHHHHLQQSATQILSAQDLVNGLDGPRYYSESEALEEVALSAQATDYTSPTSQTGKNANGNIITLTLKNNHLIVETEERAVTMEDTRSYQDGNGCSVIVEVPPGYRNDDASQLRSTEDLSGVALADQQALVHREEIPDDRSAGFGNTGLSQSDLSICSDGLNPSYRYGNQLEYEAGHYVYPMYGAGCESAGAISKWVEFDKSPDTEKTLLQDSKTPSLEKDEDVSERNSRESSGSSLEQQDSTDLSNSADTTTVVSNPNLRANGADLPMDEATSTKPVITGAILKGDEAGTQEDAMQEQQRKLGNGTLTPEHRDEPEKATRLVILTRSETSVFVPSHKRSGSGIPPRLIDEELERKQKQPSLDIYSQIKTSTKSMLPGLSPKFELLQNEVSPVDEKLQS